MKEYYTLKDLVYETGLKYRQLQNRIITIKRKYEDDRKLLYKRSNKWYIHYSIIKEFERKKFKIEYKTFITICSACSYEKQYWSFLIKDIYKNIKLMDGTTRLKYVIEKTKNGINHLHFITTFSNLTELKQIMKDNFLLSKTNDMNIDIQEIYSTNGLHKYLRKTNRPNLLK